MSWAAQLNWSAWQHPAVAAEAVLLAATLLLTVLDAILWPRRASRAGAYATFCALLLALAVALQAWDRVGGDSFWLIADRGAAFADILILSGAVLAALLAAGTPSTTSRLASSVLLLLATLGAMVAVGAADLITLFAGLELGGLALLAYQALDESPGERNGRRAALRLAGPAGAATTFVALGTACLWSAAGEPSYTALTAGIDGSATARAAVGGALLLAGLAVRAGTVPFHSWLSDVAVGSAPSAAMLTITTGVLPALVVLGRLSGGWLAAVVPQLSDLLMIIALVTAVVGGLLILAQRQLRRVLAYAVLAQVGFILAGVATHAGEEPFSGTVWLQLAALIPAVAGCLAVSGLAGAALADTAAGLARARPAQGGLLCLFLLGLAGLPPTLAFAGRSALLMALGASPLALLLLLANLLLVVAIVRFVVRVLFDTPPPASVPPASSGTIAVALLSCAVLLLFGLWPLPAARAAALAAGAG